MSADDICEEWPHNFQPAPGYWIECSRQKITSEAGCVEESGSDERELNNGSNSDGADGAQEYFGSRYGRPRGSDSLLLEDDEYYPYDDDYVMPPPRCLLNYFSCSTTNYFNRVKETVRNVEAWVLH